MQNHITKNPGQRREQTGVGALDFEVWSAEPNDEDHVTLKEGKRPKS